MLNKGGRRSSFPTRERGLKCHSPGRADVLESVVPHEGTWIEIAILVPPYVLISVVPHEGTWIEIKQKRTSSSTKNVVPHEGTWIEIRYKAAASS